MAILPSKVLTGLIGKAALCACPSSRRRIAASGSPQGPMQDLDVFAEALPIALDQARHGG
jgi:hypothetical protein